MYWCSYNLEKNRLFIRIKGIIEINEMREIECSLIMHARQLNSDFDVIANTIGLGPLSEKCKYVLFQTVNKLRKIGLGSFVNIVPSGNKLRILYLNQDTQLDKLNSIEVSSIEKAEKLLDKISVNAN